MGMNIDIFYMHWQRKIFMIRSLTRNLILSDINDFKNYYSLQPYS